MSQADLERFFQDLFQDPELQARFQEANQTNDRDGAARMAVQLGQERGYSFTVEEARSYIDQTVSTEERELSDEQLESVAGGKAAAFTDNWGCAAL